VLFKGYMGFGESLASAGVRRALAQPTVVYAGLGETFRRLRHFGMGQTMAKTLQTMQPKPQVSLARRLGETMLRLRRAGVGEMLPRVRGLFTRLGVGDVVKKHMRHGAGMGVTRTTRLETAYSVFNANYAGRAVKKSFCRGVGEFVLKYAVKTPVVFQAMPDTAASGVDFWGFYRERGRR